jgi:hypothetical protein
MLFLQSSELGLPQPITRRRVCPPPPVLGGGRGTLASGEGLGESQFRRGDMHCGTLYIYVLCGRTTAVSVPQIEEPWRELLIPELEFLKTLWGLGTD